VIEELEQLCLAVGDVSAADAKRVVEAVNGRLAALLNAHITKLYWQQEDSEDGAVYAPIAYTNDPSLPEPRQFTMRFEGEAKGVLQWVLQEGQSLWLEEIRTHYREPEQLNHATGNRVETATLSLADPPLSDSTMVVPIKERGLVHGLYSVELANSGRLNAQVLSLMNRLSRPLAALLYNADMYEYDKQKSGRAITKFLTANQAVKFDRVLLEQNCRTAFVARPFQSEFTRTQASIERALAEFGVRAKHYVAESRTMVVEEIINQIKTSHFCVADLTGNNENVLAEVGMMMVLGRKLLVLKQRGDRSTVPFDLSHYSIWEYDFSGSDLMVVDPAASGLVPFRDVLERFLGELSADTGYPFAEPWRPDGGTESPVGAQPAAV
jgi:hypothetical protein